MRRLHYWASPIVLGQAALVVPAPLVTIDMVESNRLTGFTANVYRSGTVVVQVSHDFPEADIATLRTDVERGINANGHTVQVKVERRGAAEGNVSPVTTGLDVPGPAVARVPGSTSCRGGAPLPAASSLPRMASRLRRRFPRRPSRRRPRLSPDC